MLRRTYERISASIGSEGSEGREGREQDGPQASDLCQAAEQRLDQARVPRALLPGARVAVVQMFYYVQALVDSPAH